MAEILFHPATKSAVEAAISQKTHALLLVGPVGAGKQATAEYMAAALLGVPDPAKHPYFRLVGIDKAIAVEDIRELKQFLSLKTTGKGDIRRVIIIDGADTMNDESQNALLKSLEEPPLDTVIMLTANDEQALRATIRSRAQSIQVLPPTKEVLEGYFTQLGYNAEEIEKAYRISGGLVGLMLAILSGDEAHPLTVQIEQAKQILAASQFDRLRRVDELSKQKADAVLLISALKRISSSAMEQAALRNQEANVQRWHRNLKAVSQAEAKLRHNPSLKLLLTDLFLAI